MELVPPEVSLPFNEVSNSFMDFGPTIADILTLPNGQESLPNITPVNPEEFGKDNLLRVGLYGMGVRYYIRNQLLLSSVYYFDPSLFIQTQEKISEAIYLIEDSKDLLFVTLGSLVEISEKTGRAKPVLTFRLREFLSNMRDNDWKTIPFDNSNGVYVGINSLRDLLEKYTSRFRIHWENGFYTLIDRNEE